MIALFTSLLAITLRAGTSLIFATIGEIYTERSGILNLGKMKKTTLRKTGILLLVSVLSFALAYPQSGEIKTVDPNATKETKALYANLKSIAGRQILFHLQ